MQTFVWKDIVNINGMISAEEFPISGEMEFNGEYYRIDDFLNAVAKKYQVDSGDIQTYMMDDIDFDPQALPFGAEDCGCYINGIPEWIS